MSHDEEGILMLKEELKNTAFLAKIDILEEEIDNYLKDINSMFEYIEILQEPDVATLRPTTHITELRNVWREDIVKPCSKELVTRIIHNAPEKEGYFYKIKKVIEN